MALIDAYDTRTGKRHVIPDHWLEHPVLGRGYSIDPPPAAPEVAPPATPADEPGSARSPRRGSRTPDTDSPAVGDTEKEM